MYSLTYNVYAYIHDCTYSRGFLFRANEAKTLLCGYVYVSKFCMECTSYIHYVNVHKHVRDIDKHVCMYVESSNLVSLESQVQTPFRFSS